MFAVEGWLHADAAGEAECEAEGQRGKFGGAKQREDMPVAATFHAHIRLMM